MGLLGDVTVLHSPFFGSGKLEYYLAARRPALEVRGVDAFEPVANLHRRCYLRRDPVFLRSLLRLVGCKVDRRFYFSRLLPGSQRGRAGTLDLYSMQIRASAFEGESVLVTDLLALTGSPRWTPRRATWAATSCCATT